ncbi:hypothetical protein EDD37DRAFT_115779 [Exophiala viscosa]|uniref:Uncharacterized protein n=1 Tax=Exophiala viscosa TaxID=2486360 RepID=A0AAN6DZL0_9EURO|nr:hypothetical protein EDD36DRAFT_229868 [Exophiala viscosa]KAI1621432.1 hypothetical protein EDD37DRAFT_115779 [Exophiala viscosa]
MVASTNTAFPTLSGGYNYPAPTVPPTAGAPYLASSQLPENFVFIVVGAALASVALLIFVWRVVMSWSINRAFKRDARSGAAGGAVSYTPLAEDLKKNPAAQSGHDMTDLSKLPRSFSNVPSLFFSPTAEVAKQSQRPPSQHLPSGHYRDASSTYRG